jgi:hypothetical protein
MSKWQTYCRKLKLKTYSAQQKLSVFFFFLDSFRQNGTLEKAKGKTFFFLYIFIYRRLEIEIKWKAMKMKQQKMKELVRKEIFAINHEDFIFSHRRRLLFHIVFMIFSGVLFFCWRLHKRSFTFSQLQMWKLHPLMEELEHISKSNDHVLPIILKKKHLLFTFYRRYCLKNTKAFSEMYEI